MGGTQEHYLDSFKSTVKRIIAVSRALYTGNNLLFPGTKLAPLAI